jgi:hypothetical protein
MNAVKFETFDDVCRFIRAHSMLGEWTMSEELIRSRGFCPVCWIAKKLNTESRYTTSALSAMADCGWPIPQSAETAVGVRVN